MSQDRNPAFHKVVSGLKAVHPPRNVGGLRIQPINLLKPKQEAAPVQQVAIYLIVSRNLLHPSQKTFDPLSRFDSMSTDQHSDRLSFLSLLVKQINLLNRMPWSATAHQGHACLLSYVGFSSAEYSMIWFLIVTEQVMVVCRACQSWCSSQRTRPVCMLST